MSNSAKTYNAARPQYHRLREVTTLSNLPEWQDQAACRGLPTDLFFPLSAGVNAAAAKRVCRVCTVQALCLDWALRFPCGIFGGMSERERQQERRQRQISGV